MRIEDLPPLESSITKRMTKEFKICLWLFVIYMIYIFAVPILTFKAPALMKIRVNGGMSLAWFLTAIGSTALAWIVAAVHVWFYSKDFFVEDTTEKTSKGAEM